ncbi:MAG TPA: glycerophosphodiester phosphodiesterase family protein [Caulobacteraceae bacterium]|jgi:glycerophosphoryl diester phosphodiesterase|nr:glycerophosphodiester phosphodiesterase family protein [Caulobacteraceae bacterium]
MTRPPPAGVDARAWASLFGPPVAHRGLWSAGRPENTLAAFEAAAEAGYGIELDVQLSADGEVMVFHDDRLDRLTARSGRLAERLAATLTALKVQGSDQTIPRLREVLARVAGRTLVLVELKVLGGEEGRLEPRVAEILDTYDGPAAVIGFNPHALAWFAEHRPTRLRGLNSTAYTGAADWTIPTAERRALNELEHVALARPHFLSLGLDMLPSPSARALRADGTPVLAWTVRSPAQWTRVAGDCDNLMFEGFSPEARA